VSNVTGVANSSAISCGIAGNDLTCTASGLTVTLGSQASFEITFSATPSAAGTFLNPRSGGVCAVDPHNNVTETNETNNNCSDGVFVFATTPPDEYKIAYAANLLQGDAFLNLTNAGTHNGFDPQGGICVNVYTFDASEELVSCCSCYVSPDGLRSLSAKQDLLSNTLNPGVPGSIVIRLLATVPNPGPTCNAAGPFQANPISPTNPGDFESGLRAWAATLHQNTPSGGFHVTENPFQDASLNTSELAKLTAYCGFIQANGSGYGVCKSCRFGGLGGTKQ
jgi:hypothetical protein